MLRTLPQTRETPLAGRLAGIGVFALITVVAARLTVPMDPVPFTLETLAALLAGMVLGARDGALSQLIYVGLIAVGLPVDANMRGQAALFGPTGGYLVGFIAAAFIAGWLVEHGANRLWQRLAAGIVGAVVIYVFGVPVLMLARGLDLGTALSFGVVPFLVPDFAKAALAVALAEGGRTLLSRRSA